MLLAWLESVLPWLVIVTPWPETVVDRLDTFVLVCPSPVLRLLMLREWLESVLPWLDTVELNELKPELRVEIELVFVSDVFLAAVATPSVAVSRWP